MHPSSDESEEDAPYRDPENNDVAAADPSFDMVSPAMDDALFPNHKGTQKL